MSRQGRRRDHGEGTIEQRGKNSWRLRYRLPGIKHQQKKTVRGSKTDALAALRNLLHAKDTGAHVEPNKLTFGKWLEHWIVIGCPGQRRKSGRQRTIERYAEMMNLHVKPTFENRLLQQLQASEIDALYTKLEDILAPMTLHHVHTTLGACIGTAVRQRKIARNPMLELAKIPSPGESDHGMCLDDDQMRTLVKGFNGHSLYGIVATGSGTGARRGEMLALAVTAFDPKNKTLKIERSLEETKKHKLRFVPPKTERSKRTIDVDDDLAAILQRQVDKLKRIKAGVGDDAKIDLSLVKLPKNALLFPRPPRRGHAFSFSAPRRPRNVTKEFTRKAAKLGFPDLRLHDLRGSHATILLDRGENIAEVAKRGGHDPVTLMRYYLKHTRKGQARLAETINAVFKGAY